MPLPLALQLYSLRDDASRDLPGVIRRVAAMGYKGIEYAGLHGFDPCEIGRLVSECGMEAVSALVTLPTEDTIDRVLEDVSALGIHRLISGGGPAQFEDMKSILSLAKQFETTAGLLEKHGIELGFHNHWWEFNHRVDGSLPYDIFMNATRKVFAELDVYWACFGGVNPVDVVSRHAGRVKLMHVKDGLLDKTPDGYPLSPHTAVGQGKVDIKGFIAKTQTSGVVYLIVELDNCASDMDEAVCQSAAFLIEEGLAEGTARYTPRACSPDRT